jgi:hypothetical protein
MAFGGGHGQPGPNISSRMHFFIKEVFIITSEAIHRVDTKPKRVTMHIEQRNDDKFISTAVVVPLK